MRTYLCLVALLMMAGCETPTMKIKAPSADKAYFGMHCRNGYNYDGEIVCGPISIADAKSLVNDNNEMFREWINRKKVRADQLAQESVTPGHLSWR